MPEPTPDPKPSPRKAIKLNRRRFLIATGVVAVGAGAYAHWVEPFWPEFHEMPMAIRGLPAGLEGYRITHLTDLHVSDVVPMSYLQSVVERVNALQPDLVVITGDLIMRGSLMVGPAVELVGRLKAPTVVTFGNHDYGIFRPGQDGPASYVADTLEKGLLGIGCTVLRNHSTTITRGTGSLNLVGLEDLWSGLFEPVRAFAEADRLQPVIALSHNPDTVPALEGFKPDWILCGHTHGGQVRIPLVGPIVVPVTNRQWSQGFFRLKDSRLYVSRAVGYLLKVRFCYRPEVPTFTLTRNGAV